MNSKNRAPSYWSPDVFTLFKTITPILHNKRPDIVAFEVEATLVECPLKIFIPTPANFNTVFIHPVIIEETTSLYSLMVPSKSWVCLLPFLHSEELNLYSSRAVIIHHYYQSNHRAPQQEAFALASKTYFVY